MSEAHKPTYLVNPEADPVLIRVEGRASFANSVCVQDFCQEMIAAGKPRFVVDFAGCTSMDSTFLGTLAGVALDLRRMKPKGTLVATRLNPRNLELFQNLGLHRLLLVDDGVLAEADSASEKAKTQTLMCAQRPEIEHARLVLAAHENLVKADSANETKFQDVLTFMRQRIAQG